MALDRSVEREAQVAHTCRYSGDEARASRCRTAIVITCDQCKKRAASPGHRTVTQRVLCDDCHNRMLGAAAGVLAAGPGASTTSTVQSAVVTSGLFASMRRWRKARRSDK